MDYDGINFLEYNPIRSILNVDIEVFATCSLSAGQPRRWQATALMLAASYTAQDLTHCC